MELFYSQSIQNDICTLDEEESRHCMKVLRHVPGDVIQVIDGLGTLMECKIRDTAKQVSLQILSRIPDFASRPYRLHMAVAPTKNMDRYEWFLEKATEVGVDSITPVIGEHSERKVLKPERCRKILLSAAKQSLKGALPLLNECCSVREFIKYSGGRTPALKLIAYCGDGGKRSLEEEIQEYRKNNGDILPEVTILIGPEGDFSPGEVEMAISCGFKPVHLGTSRMRTETAAVAAVCCVYFMLGAV